MSDYGIGSWVQPHWQGHAYAGQTGQIIDDGINSNDVEFWKIDTNGDGTHDYTVNKGSYKFLDGSMLHQGALTDNVTQISTYTANMFDIVVPIIISAVGFAILAKKLKKLNQS